MISITSTFLSLSLSLSLFSLTFLTSAAPTPSAITDTDILNYALTLEHLESAFYAGGLAKFDQAAFTSAGLPEFTRGRFAQIAKHEASHVAYLEAALGDGAVKACEYNFTYTDPRSFVALSMILEGVGTSAYLGAASSISNPKTLTAAGSILTTESRHAAWVASAVQNQNPWSGAYDTPLGFNQVYSLAAAFITSCPAENPVLPVKAYPALVVGGEVKAGGLVSLRFKCALWPSLSLALLSGLETIFIPIEYGKVQIPAGLQGTVYAIVTNSSEGGSVTDANTVAGPVILLFPFDSTAALDKDSDEIGSLNDTCSWYEFC